MAPVDSHQEVVRLGQLVDEGAKKMLKVKTIQFRLVIIAFHLKKVCNERKDVAEEKDNDNSKEHDGKTELPHLEGNNSKACMRF